MDLRELPKGWIKNTLREVTTSQKGKLPKEFSEIPKDGFIPYIDIEAFETGNIKRFAAINATTIATPNDVLVVWDGARFGLSGKCGGGVVGSTIVKLSSDIVERDYLLNFIRLHYHTINSRPRGTGTPHVEPEVFWPLEIGIPPLNEQRRIVEKIETLFAQLDAGEAALKQVQQQLARYRQSVLKTAVTGALTADWRAENAHRLEHGSDLLARILKTRRENWQGRGKYKEPAAPNTSELPELPQGWVWASAEQITTKITDGTHHSPTNKDKGEFKYITAKNIKDWGIDLSDITYVDKTVHEEIYSRCDVRLNDLLYIKDGATTGICTINNLTEQFSLLSSVAMFRFSEFVLPRYAKIVLDSPEIREKMLDKMSGSAITRLTLKKLNATLFPVPPISEQEIIVEMVNKYFERLCNLEKLAGSELTRAAALRQSILKDAFSGKLVAQDPNDEPADVLLARIRTERAQNIPAKTARGRKPSVRTKT